MPKIELRIDDQVYDGEVVLRADPPKVDAYEPKPGQTIADALAAIGKDGPSIIALAAGPWELGTPEKTKMPQRPIDIIGLSPDAILHQTAWKKFRPFCPVRYEGLTVDFANIYEFQGTCVGFDKCYWTSSKGWLDEGIERHKNVNDPNYYFRNGRVFDMKFGPTLAAEVSGSHLEKISGDCFQHSLLVRSCTVNNVDGSILPHHTDLFQLWIGKHGVTWEDVHATNMKGVQCFMLESHIGRDVPNITGPFDPAYTITGLTVRNIRYESEPITWGGRPDHGGPPHSHMMGYFQDCLFENVYMPHQKILARKQFDHGGQRNVIFKNCTLHRDTKLGEAVIVND